MYVYVQCFFKKWVNSFQKCWLWKQYQNKWSKVSIDIQQKSQRLVLFILNLSSNLFVGIIRIIYLYWKFLSFESMVLVKGKECISLHFKSSSWKVWLHFKWDLISKRGIFLSWNEYKKRLTFLVFAKLSNKYVSLVGFMLSVLSLSFQTFGILASSWWYFKKWDGWILYNSLKSWKL